MKESDIYNTPKCAGIYLFKNKINNKCYVGQSVKIRKRLIHHLNNFKRGDYQNITLYKAFRKYGLDNFELTILDTFTEALSQETKDKLDSLEKYYIQKYNSYGSTGYNSTLGGDKGVLGFKHDPEVVKNFIKTAQDNYYSNTDNWVKAKNVITGETIMSIGTKYLADIIGANRASVSKALNGKIKVLKNWVIVRYGDDYPYFESKNYIDKSAYIEQIKEILKNNPYTTPKEAVELGINRNTFMHYRKLLGLTPKLRVDTKVRKEDFLLYSKNHSKDEVIKYFNISERSYYKYSIKYLN